MEGVGSSPACYSSVLSHFNMDECRGNETILTPKKEATKFSLYFLHCLRHFTSFLWLSLYLSKQTKPEHQTIRGHQNKKEQRIWVLCLQFYHFWQEWSDWVPPKRRWSLRNRMVISHPPCTPAFSWLPQPCENFFLGYWFWRRLSDEEKKGTIEDI